MIEGRCKTCKWWYPNAEPKKYADALAHYAASGYGEHTQLLCTNKKVGPLGEGADEASDAEGYGGIYTGPDFGCIHWEAKE